MATDMLHVAGSHRMAPDQTQPRPQKVAAPHSSAILDLGPSPDLRAIVSQAVVPRLRQIFGAAPAHDRSLVADPAGGMEVGRVEDFVDRLLRADVVGVCADIDAVRAGGHPLGRIYLELLMPAALRLAQRVTDDLCDSTEAALAFCNLQIILRRYADEFHGEAGQPPSGLRALLVSPPVGVQAGAGLQVFGLVFAAEFFRRDGWDVWTERSLNSADFKDVVLRQWFDLVEVLATEQCDLDVLATGIRHIRRGAPNPRVGIVACGQLFEDHPEYVGMIGADRSASDPLASLAHARHLVFQRNIARPTQRRRLS